MNLSAYDVMQPKFEKGTWINPTFMRLYSTEIKCRNFYTYLKRYDPSIRNYFYYIAMTDKPIENAYSGHVICNKDNIVVINLKYIWNDSPLINIKEKTFINISLSLEDEDGEIYQLDI